MAAVAEGAYGLPWQPEIADEILAMRERLEASRTDRRPEARPRRPRRRRVSGADVPAQVRPRGARPCAGRTPGRRWTRCGRRPAVRRRSKRPWRAAYDFLLRVQSRLRIVHNRSLDELPESAEEIDKLARRLGYDSGDLFLGELERHRTRTRELFLHLLGRERRLSIRTELHGFLSEPRTQRSGVSGRINRLLRCAACAARTLQRTVSGRLATPAENRLATRRFRID